MLQQRAAGAHPRCLVRRAACIAAPAAAGASSREAAVLGSSVQLLQAPLQRSYHAAGLGSPGNMLHHAVQLCNASAAAPHSTHCFPHVLE